MSSTGNGFDGAIIESFLGTLRAKRATDQRYQISEHARHDIVSYIEGFYHATRCHSALDCRGPSNLTRLRLWLNFFSTVWGEDQAKQREDGQ
jgi:putative transposase